jgi:hypothetical protein
VTYALPNQEVFGVILRKLVKVRPGCEKSGRHLEWDDGNLNHILAGNKAVVELQFERMNDVFRVVQNNDLIPDSLFTFGQKHSLVNPVQAIGFVGRPGMRADYDLNSPVSLPNLCRLQPCGLIVGVRPQKNVEVLIIKALERIKEHLLNYSLFLPGRDEYRNPFLRDGVKLLLIYGPDFGSFEQSPVEFSQPVIEINEKVIETANQEGNGDDCSQKDEGSKHDNAF